MAFTFDAGLSNEVSLVRFHIGDTNVDGYYLEDETINYFLTETLSVGKTVVSCIKYIISQLSQPAFELDWLSVSTDEAIEGFKYLLKEKASELGVSASGASANTSVTNPYRVDSYQTDGDYDGTP